MEVTSMGDGISYIDIHLQITQKPNGYNIENIPVIDEFSVVSNSNTNTVVTPAPVIELASTEHNQYDESTANDNHETKCDTNSSKEKNRDCCTIPSLDSKFKKSKTKCHDSRGSGEQLRTKVLKNIKKIRKSSKSTADEDKILPKKSKCGYPRLCAGCGHAYKTKQSFWNHKQRCAMLPENRRRMVWDDGVPRQDDDSGNVLRRKEYICAHCDRPYRKKYNLQEHLKNTCRGKPGNKGRLQCWEENCTQAFYKYLDLVHHVTLQHGKDLQIQKLQFPNYTAFNSWKTEECNSKFMYARKITGSKSFSNTKYHYFVCQFNHRNEKKNNKRKTDRRKSVNLVVPNYNCPSRIMVKECENQILVTYISSHNHELNLSNVKYQPLEKETRTYIKTLLTLGVSANKIKQHLQEGVGNPEIDSFLTTKQQFLTLSRIKRMESKLKAKNRVRENSQEAVDAVTVAGSIDESVTGGESFFPDDMDLSASVSCQSKSFNVKKGDNVIKSIEMNLKKLKGYMHKSNVKEKLSDRISKMIQDLCDECENVDSGEKSTRKARGQRNRKHKTEMPPMDPTIPTSVSIPAPVPTQVIMQQMQPNQAQIQQLQPIIEEQHQSLQSHIILPHPLTIVDQNSLVTNPFTPVIYDNVDLVKAMYQPFNVNLLSLKSLDPYIPQSEQGLLARVDSDFIVGYLYDAIINNFLQFLCQSLSNAFYVSTGTLEYLQMNQKVPDVWQCCDWRSIDTLFIPCTLSKKQWFLMVTMIKHSEVKSAELQIFDPLCTFDGIYDKKYENYISSWCSVLNSTLGISNCYVTFPTHMTHSDPSNSGVLVCWYVFQYINKRNLADNIDIDLFRKYIYDTIISNASHS